MVKRDFNLISLFGGGTATSRVKVLLGDGTQTSGVILISLFIDGTPTGGVILISLFVDGTPTRDDNIFNLSQLF